MHSCTLSRNMFLKGLKYPKLEVTGHSSLWGINSEYHYTAYNYDCVD